MTVTEERVMVCRKFRSKKTCCAFFCEHWKIHYENENCGRYGGRCPKCLEARAEEIVLARMADRICRVGKKEFRADSRALERLGMVAEYFYKHSKVEKHEPALRR